MRLAAAALAVVMPLLASGTAEAQGAMLNELGAFSTSEKLERVMRKSAESCIRSRRGFEICAWALSNRDKAWRRIANGIDTRERVTVVCERATDSADTTKGRCAAWGRSKVDFDDALSRARALGATTAVLSSGSESEAARDAIQNAASMFDLSLVVGDAPERCLQRGAERRECRWTLTNKSRGYDIAAAAAGGRGRIALACMFADDSPAPEPGSCRSTAQK